MNDQQLTALLKLAAEADRLAGGAARLPAAVLGPGSMPAAQLGRGVHAATGFYAAPGVRAARWWIAAGAAAAAIGIAVVSVSWNPVLRQAGEEFAAARAPASSANSRPFDSSQLTVTPSLAHASSTSLTGNIMLAVFTDECGERTCIVTHDHDELRGRDPTKMSDEELLKLALGDRCGSAVEQVTVIGLSGPDGSLPRTNAQAELLAMCLGTAPFASQPASTLLSCVPPGVSVVMASLSLSATAKER